MQARYECVGSSETAQLGAVPKRWRDVTKSLWLPLLWPCVFAATTVAAAAAAASSSSEDG